uniref:Uncharacterized protein LOC111135633 isoform X1 n=1 Tax=Crassostrea virginica TaxID=6565 RepID=A0A8B8ENT5_CRAVI|nr:uncharacterized protein LOC111135633 isoform X1 [Crassostrea virginica]
MDTTGPRIHPLLLALLLALTTAAAIGAEVDRSKTDSGLFPEFKTIIDSLSKTVDEFLNNTLSVFRNLPPHYKNISTEIVNKNGRNFLKNTTIIKDSTNGSFYGMFMEKSEKMDNSTANPYVT